jgi:hypothetical protein
VSARRTDSSFLVFNLSSHRFSLKNSLVWSSSSSSYCNTGFYFDSYTIWKYKCSFYRSSDKHNESAWRSWVWWYIYDDFSRLFFLHVNRETSVLTNEIPEESDQFRFLRPACYAKWFSGVDFGESFGNENFLRVLSAILTPHSFIVTFFTPRFSPLFILLQINNNETTLHLTDTRWVSILVLAWFFH